MITVDVTEVAVVQKALYFVSHHRRLPAGSQSDSEGTTGFWHPTILTDLFVPPVRKSVGNSEEFGL